jgi:hypothetical protein
MSAKISLMDYDRKEEGKNTIEETNNKSKNYGYIKTQKGSLITELNQILISCDRAS